MTTGRDEVLAALKRVADPVAGGNIVTSGVVRAPTVEGGTVRFVMEVPPDKAADYGPVQREAERLLTALPGIEKVSVVMTAHREKPAPPPDLKPKRPERTGPEPIPGVAHIIAVASGKGGVGKSTVAANLACALAQEGRRVGLLDADVYGPSQPRMLGVSGRPASPDGKTILPLRNHGVTMMSIGLMINEDQAVVWRGPMLMGALQQMMRQVQWGALDVLLVDLPPGTGDVQLTLAQRAKVDGAIIVSTPQDVALLDARKAIDMFRQLGVPILGMIENMSTHVCSNCGHEEHVFGHGGVAREAERLGVPLLAELPLDLDTRIASDGGAPIVTTAPDSRPAQVFRDLAAALVAQGVA
ncbi:MAG: iron-sulfur cluster carrier protein ApbC [Alphaproteobacteria bacterium]|nr:MAG: iron-sulfur cluster carrier protein ApbC [Alphaproteobacteria bacterium]